MLKPVASMFHLRAGFYRLNGFQRARRYLPCAPAVRRLSLSAGISLCLAVLLQVQGRYPKPGKSGQAASAIQRRLSSRGAEALAGLDASALVFVAVTARLCRGAPIPFA